MRWSGQGREGFMNKWQTQDDSWAQPWLSWLVFAAGLAVWMAVQGSFAVSVMSNRSLPPEPDDTLTLYLENQANGTVPAPRIAQLFRIC